MAAYAASKAAVEQFANCLRLEVAHKGVKVGSVHPGWIDTDLVRDQRKDLKTFDEAFDKFPWPMNATTSVEDCADAIVDGMERRRRRVYVPKAIALVQALRTLTTGASATGSSAARRGRWCPRWRPRSPSSAATSAARAWRCRRRRPPGSSPSSRSDDAAPTTRPAAAGHRARLTGGLAAAIAEKGYATVTIADVVGHARVSKRTFYEHFADKEACFLALYSETSDELLDLIAEAAASADGPWDERLGAAARAYFERVAGEPELIRAALLEIQAAGPRARGLRREVQRRYAEQLRALSIAAAAEEAGHQRAHPRARDGRRRRPQRADARGGRGGAGGAHGRAGGGGHRADPRRARALGRRSRRARPPRGSGSPPSAGPSPAPRRSTARRPRSSPRGGGRTPRAGGTPRRRAARRRAAPARVGDVLVDVPQLDGGAARERGALLLRRPRGHRQRLEQGAAPGVRVGQRHRSRSSARSNSSATAPTATAAWRAAAGETPQRSHSSSGATAASRCGPPSRQEIASRLKPSACMARISFSRSRCSVP